MGTVTVMDRHGGIRYAGRSVAATVRRVWGRGAEVRPSGRCGGAELATVTRRDRYGVHVLAEITYYGGTL